VVLAFRPFNRLNYPCDGSSTEALKMKIVEEA
jgi:hypothetical protein